MEKQRISKKDPKLNEFKIRTSITIDPEIHAKIGRIGLNLSYFTEMALNWLYSHIKKGDDQLLTRNTLILSLYLQNSHKNEWSRRDSNP